MTKDKFNWKFCLCCGLFIWFIVNLLQGIFTEIQEDEAYYVLYGEHLAWGYFDHPPMVGLMTFLSSLFFSGTLGVRFFTILASCLSLFTMWKIIDDKQPDKEKILLFFTLACSIVMFNIYGFVTTPDVELILFSALFLLVYQRYLIENTWPHALLMGVLMACMIYSKYHAFLLLGLIVLSNLKLLKDGKFYVACLVTLTLLAPHILWQINTDFPSFKYHLSQRSEPFRWSYFFEYLPNQLLIFNPLTFGAVVYVLIKHSPERATRTGAGVATPAENQVFERGLKFILIGFFFFFWLMAFRGHVEPHWTIVCVIPAVVLVYRKALIDEKLRKYTMRFILPSLLLVLTFRILLLTPLADRFGYHGKEKYYKAIEQVAGDCPVVFRGSFQPPALYHYFTGKESSTLQCYYDRMTQYDLWQFDKAWIGKEVFICGPVNGRSESYQVGNVEIEGFLSDDFSSANRLVTTFEITNAGNDNTPVFHHGDTIRVDFSIYNPSEAPINFQHKDFKMAIKAQYLPGDAFSFCFYKKIMEIEPQDTYQGQLYTIVNEEISPGDYHFNLGIGDRVSSFVTEESGVTLKIVP
ncbi:MAG: glycosyltransferase family 39 protein [Bacteroidales bacterium]|nr:glycosyltransferase family 39 protein [Bacteroidales bacterium]MBR6930374.1 glycosyltransferase family 39 protein [Bacteroidales bacterium]